jgi:hypothetical protein
VTFWMIIRNSLRQHALSTAITAVSIALATGLLMSIWAVKDQSMRAFTNVTGGYDAVMGSRGSELSLVLFSVFHMDKAPGTLPWEDLEFLTNNAANRRVVRYAVPMVVGDNFGGFRIVGTQTNYFRLPQMELKRIAGQYERTVEQIDDVLKALRGKSEYNRTAPVLERVKGPLKEIIRLGQEPGKETRQKLSRMSKLLEPVSKNLATLKLPDDKGESKAMEFREKANREILRLTREIEQLTSATTETGPVLTVHSGGRWFQATKQEAVIGSYAARVVEWVQEKPDGTRVQRKGLRVGDVFRPVHGLNREGTIVHPADYLVVGILQPSNTPADHVIWIPIKGAQNMPGHDAEKSTDISAILIKFKSARQGPIFADQVNKGTRDKSVAMIAVTVTRFFQRFEWLGVVLGAMAAMVALVGAGGILASLYNTMNERRREIAILRSLGARRGTVFGAIVLESTAITTLGVLLGFVFYAGFLAAAAHLIQQETGVVIDPLESNLMLAAAPGGIIALGTLAGILPAMKAYRTDVAENLIPQS